MMLVAALLAVGGYAQTAKSVLDKAAATITAPQGVKANFKLSATSGSTSGTIAIKGTMFYAHTPKATVWYNGKTQWTLMKKTNEVNIPKAEKLREKLREERGDEVAESVYRAFIADRAYLEGAWGVIDADPQFFERFGFSEDELARFRETVLVRRD